MKECGAAWSSATSRKLGLCMLQRINFGAIMHSMSKKEGL